MKQWQKIGLVGLVLIGILWWWKTSQSSSSVPHSEQQKPVNAILDSDWSLGNRQAKVIVVEYSDLQCPACQHYSEAGTMLIDRFGGDVGFTYRHFPLREIHKNANLAAQAAEAAGKQGKFWEMETLLFDKQAEWESSKQVYILFVGYAEGLGLDLNQFRQDIDSAAVKAEVEADYISGLVSKVNATPTFFINGQKINNLKGMDDLIARVQFELEAATASGTAR